MSSRQRSIKRQAQKPVEYKSLAERLEAWLKKRKKRKEARDND